MGSEMCIRDRAFQRLMDTVLRGLDFTFVYLDDILIASTSLDQHLLHVRQVFDRLRRAGLAINKKKCRFGLPRVSFLGHEVTSGGILPMKSKVSGILDMPRPETKVDLQRFLGCVNFYHRFLPHLADVLAPLHGLTSSASSQKSRLEWTPAQISAFSAAKTKLSDAVQLVHPRPDARLFLTTDASDVALGAVLSQGCLLYTSPSPRDGLLSRMPSSA